MWAAAAVCAFMAGLMVSHDVDFLIWLPVLFGSGLVLWALIRNPQTGLRITDDALILSPWQTRQVIPLAEIEAVKYHEWSDSTDVYIWLKSGETVRVSPLDAPPVKSLRSVLAEKAIPIIET